jgi:hypothetical protein
MTTRSIRRHYGARRTQISDIREIARHFRFDGAVVSADRYGSGHINDTFVANVKGNRGETRFLLQRINKQVFHDPAALMHNIWRICEHLKKKSAASSGYLSLVPTIDEQHFYEDEDAECWRAYRFIEDAVAYDIVQSTRLAREAAAMFGGFQSLVSDLPGPRLIETIPGFHDTPLRYQLFHDAVANDSYGRAQECSPEIDRALAFEEVAGKLAALQESGHLPERIVHNDTKLNNLLFDRHSKKALCVVDLDTVMPGLAVHDFGDMVRTATSPAGEDETDFSRIGLRLDYYEALVEGYLGATSDFLTGIEIENLSLAGKTITIETGLRFLTDFLSGDQYFKTRRPEQNLDRCRAQFALADSIGMQFEEMQKVVKDVASRISTREADDS